MFIFSVKAGRKKIVIGLAALLLIVTAAIVLTKLHNSKPIASAAGMKYNVSAATNEERIAFLGQFGWKVTAEPVEIKEVTIPEKFDDVYINYNNIQKEQGLDLAPYAGKTCKQWIYAVTNYPQVPEVRATMLVYSNRVIGGDLSTAALDGFMTGFTGEQESSDYSMKVLQSSSPASEAEAKPKSSSAIPANAWPTD